MRVRQQISRLTRLSASTQKLAQSGVGANSTGKSAVSNDYRRDAGLQRQRDEVKHVGIRSAAAVPITKGEASIGAMLFCFEQADTLND
jgi:hypothetical protein